MLSALGYTCYTFLAKGSSNSICKMRWVNTHENRIRMRAVLGLGMVTINTVEKIWITLGFLEGSDSKESTCSAGDGDSIHVLRRSTGEGHGNPLLYSCLENSKNRGAWWATVHGVTNSQTQLRNSHFSLGHIYSTNIYQCLQCISHYT